MENSKHVYRLICGYTRCKVGDKTYLVNSPTYNILYEAEEKYEEALEDQRFNESMRKVDAARLLIVQGIWYKDGEKMIKKNETEIENLKVEMYKNYRLETRLKEILKKLEKAERTQQNLLERKHKYDNLTKEGYAEFVKQNYIMLHSVTDISGNRLWANTEDCNTTLLNLITSSYREQILSHEQLRELARTEPFRSIWRIEGVKVFKNPCLNDEQKSFVLYSQMYDSVHSHSECPPDEVVNNDNLLDGWMILNRREAEVQRAEREKESNVSEGMKHHKEVFKMVGSAEEAKEVYELNDDEARATVRARQKAIKAHGELKQSQLPDVQMELRQQLQEKVQQKLKGK